jgi:hypothetical protein
LGIVLWSWLACTRFLFHHSLLGKYISLLSQQSIERRHTPNQFLTI